SDRACKVVAARGVGDQRGGLRRSYLLRAVSAAEFAAFGGSPRGLSRRARSVRTGGRGQCSFADRWFDDRSPPPPPARPGNLAGHYLAAAFLIALAATSVLGRSASRP